MPGKEIDNWYTKFALDLKNEMGINIYNASDMRRLRIPEDNGLGTKQLFDGALKNTEEEKIMLYEQARSGKLFVFQKDTNKPFQATENGMYSCEAEDEKERASFSQKAGYWGGKFGMGGSSLWNWSGRSSF